MYLFIKKTIFLGVSCFCFSVAAIAQQSNIWYFGNHAGLTFATSPPTPLMDGQLISWECGVTQCNKSGQLLFYTDGISVYNRNHQLMPNGSALAGCISSTNSGIAIPSPADTNIYYIFTSDCEENHFVKGYTYSVLDMRLDSSLGDITSIKNVPLYAPGTERLTGVRHANGIDYWVITKAYNNNRFSVYKVDCNGINTTPINSDVGMVPDMYFEGQGAIKLSPNGKKLCVATIGITGVCQLFDFDKNTGIVSNPIDLTGFSTALGAAYGVEFSPDGKQLYFSVPLTGEIYQFDISSNNPALINASRYSMPATAPPYFDPPGALQLGPDHKIYVADNGGPYVSVINNPNVHGSGCNFAFDAISLNGRTCIAGLPVYIVSNFDTSHHANFTYNFVDCHVQFQGNSDFTGNVIWNWDFGDGSFGTGQTVNHSFHHVGSYNVTLNAIPMGAGACSVTGDTAIISHTVAVNNVFDVDYGVQGNCLGDTYQFSDSTAITVGNITGYTWDFGDLTPVSHQQNPAHLFANTGAYTVKLVVSSSGICNADSSIKTIYVDDRPSIFDSFANGCIGLPVSFTDKSTNGIGGVSFWKWFFGDGDSSILKNPSHSYFNYGNFNVQLYVSSAHGCSIGPLAKPINIESIPVADFDFQFPCVDKPTVFTNASNNVYGNIVNQGWSFGDNTSSGLVNPTHQYLTTLTGTVNLTVKTQNGCSTALSKPIVITPSFANAGKDSIALYDQPYQLTGSGPGTYLWSPATNLNNPTLPNPTVRLKFDQLFTLTTTNAQGCSATDNVFITVVTNVDIYVPSAIVPNGNAKNRILMPYCVGIDHLNYFKVFNRYGQQVFSTTSFNDGWDARIQGIEQPQGTYVWMVEGVDIFGRTIKKSGTTVLLH